MRKNSSCMTLTAFADLVKPQLNFLPYFMSKVVNLNIPRGGGPASAPMLQPHQTRSCQRDAHVLGVSAF